LGRQNISLLLGELSLIDLSSNRDPFGCNQIKKVAVRRVIPVPGGNVIGATCYSDMRSCRKLVLASGHFSRRLV